MEIANTNASRKITLGNPQYNILITKANIRKQMKTIDKTLITHRLKIKGESLTYNRVLTNVYRIYRDVVIQYDDRQRRMLTLLNWI